MEETIDIDEQMHEREELDIDMYLAQIEAQF